MVGLLSLSTWTKIRSQAITWYCSQYQRSQRNNNQRINRLCELGVLEFQPTSECTSPSFIIPKKYKTVCFTTDFRDVNRTVATKPFPIPKISTVSQELEGFTFATSLDFNMHFYTIWLDPDAFKICIIIFYGVSILPHAIPMGIVHSLQAKMSELWVALFQWFDCITKASLYNHLNNLRLVLTRLCPKSKICAVEAEYCIQHSCLNTSVACFMSHELE